MRHVALLLVLSMSATSFADSTKARGISPYATMHPNWRRTPEPPSFPPQYNAGCIAVSVIGPQAILATKAIEAWAEAYGNPVCPAGEPPAGTIVLATLTGSAAKASVHVKLSWALGIQPGYHALPVNARLKKLASTLTGAANSLAKARH